jgi:hypothetical protein
MFDSILEVSTPKFFHQTRLRFMTYLEKSF